MLLAAPEPSAAGFVVLLAILFALQAAQLQLGGIISPALASLTVAAGLLVVAGFVLLAAWLRQRQNRTGTEIGKAMLATVPLANDLAQKVNPQLLVAAVVLTGAAILGNRLGRKD